MTSSCANLGLVRSASAAPNLRRGYTAVGLVGSTTSTQWSGLGQEHTRREKGRIRASPAGIEWGAQGTGDDHQGYQPKPTTFGRRCQAGGRWESWAKEGDGSDSSRTKKRKDSDDCWSLQRL